MAGNNFVAKKLNLSIQSVLLLPLIQEQLRTPWTIHAVVFVHLRSCSLAHIIRHKWCELRKTNHLISMEIPFRDNEKDTWQTYLEGVEVLRHNICPHQAVVDQVATMLVVITHPA